MFHWIIDRLFRQRHFWRTVSFDEIAQLYVSRLLTVFAINSVNLLAAVYLYKMGYSMLFIACYYTCMYASKLPISLIAGKITAYYGPKHAILFGNLLRIPSLVAFALVPEVGMPAIVLFGAFQAISICCYDIGYAVDFSKIKHPDHAGKEIGTMNMIEKAAKVLSPLIGGVIAAIFSPTVVIIAASILFALSSIPLFRTVEPTVVRTKIRYRDFSWKLARWPLVAQVGTGIDWGASGIIWTMFITTVVFASAGNSVYAAIGGLASLGVILSMVASWTYGKIIDKNSGNRLVVVGAVINAIVHVLRPQTVNASGVVGANIASETATSAYSMALMRTNFDVADTSGARIMFMTYAEIAVNLGILIICASWAALIYFFGEKVGTASLFYIAAVGVLLIIPANRRR